MHTRQFLPPVIPAKAVVRQAHHPEQRRRRIQCIYKWLKTWMPDFIRLWRASPAWHNW